MEIEPTAEQLACDHRWEEVDTDEDETGEPPYDQCYHCGLRRY
jgi:hypothetical protein